MLLSLLLCIVNYWREVHNFLSLDCSKETGHSDINFFPLNHSNLRRIALKVYIC